MNIGRTDGRATYVGPRCRGAHQERLSGIEILRGPGQELDGEGLTSPMTYVGRDGKQYLVVVSSGVNAFSLN